MWLVFAKFLTPFLIINHYISDHQYIKESLQSLHLLLKLDSYQFEHVLQKMKAL